MSDRGLKSIVADLYEFGYCAADIARVVGRSERRIGQILQEIKPRPSPLRTVDDLPADLRQRVRDWLEIQTLNTTTVCSK